MTIGWQKTAGPFRTLAEAEAAKARLGSDNHTILVTVDSGDRAQYCVEKMIIRPHGGDSEGLIFGRTWGEIQAMQQGRVRG